MKPFFALLVLTATAVGGDTFDDMLLRDGTVLKNVEVKEVTARGLKVTHKDGSGLIKTEQLPAEVKKRYGTRIAAAAKAASADTPVQPSAKEEPKPGKPAAAIAGLEPATVVQLCEKQGLSLTLRGGAGGAGSGWTGKLKDDTADIDVTASGPDKDSMAAVTATVTATGSDRARTVFSALAAIPYTGAGPARARQWVSDNIDTDDAKIAIGGVAFRITAKAGAPHTRTLHIALQ